jgi:hypothetical protein
MTVYHQTIHAEKEIQSRSFDTLPLKDYQTIVKKVV